MNRRQRKDCTHMRMRLKKWARPELDACPFYVKRPEELKGKWKTAFACPDKPLHIEFGCGKGVSTALMALSEPEINFAAADINTSVLGVAKRNAEAAFEGKREVDNLRLFNFEVEIIDRVFSGEDGAERIYISFPNPWTQRHRDEKHRLTHTRQLALYRGFLKDGGEIWFKTDDDTLFADSLEYFRQSGFELRFVTYDLHSEEGIVNYMSEHEKMFTAEGIKTKALIAVKRPLTEN